MKPYAENPNIRLLAVKHGGHLGFLASAAPRFWVDRVLLEWISATPNEIATPGEYDVSYHARDQGYSAESGGSSFSLPGKANNSALRSWLTATESEYSSKTFSRSSRT